MHPIFTCLAVPAFSLRPLACFSERLFHSNSLCRNTMSDELTSVLKVLVLVPCKYDQRDCFSSRDCGCDASVDPMFDFNLARKL